MGGSSFAPAVVVANASTPISGLAVDDVDRDGDLDIVVGFPDINATRLFRNLNGLGSVWSPGTTMPNATAGVQAVAIFDLDTGTVLPFDAPDVVALAASDFNEDGRVDFAFSGAMTSQFGVCLGQYFRAWHCMSVSLPNKPFIDIKSLSTGDFDGDGSIDLMLGDFEGLFYVPTITAPYVTMMPLEKAYTRSNLDGVRDVFVVDVDGDALLDVVLHLQFSLSWMRYDAELASFERVRTLVDFKLQGDMQKFTFAALRNSVELMFVASQTRFLYFFSRVTTSSGTSTSYALLSAVTLPFNLGNVTMLAAHDLNNNAQPELIVVGEKAMAIVTVVFVGGSSNSFVIQQTIRINGTFASVLVGDYTNDEKADILASSAGNVTLFVNTGIGTFASPVLVLNASSDARFAVVRMNAAKLQTHGDLFVVQSLNVSWLAADSSGVGWNSTLNRVGSFPGPVVTFTCADITNDGLVDVIGLDSSDNDESFIYMFVNNGANTFLLLERAEAFLGDNVHVSIALAVDVIDDSIVDFVIAGSSFVRVFRSVPQLGHAKPSAGRLAELPIACAGIPNEFFCLSALIGQRADACFPSSVPFIGPMSGCLLDQPLRLTGIAPLEIFGRRGGPPSDNRITCSNSERLLFRVDAGIQLTLRDVSMRITAGNGNSLKSSSLISVCDSTCSSSDVAQLTLIRVAIDGFVNTGDFSLFAQDRGLGALSVFGAGRVLIQESQFVNNSNDIGGGAITSFGPKAAIGIYSSRFSGNSATGKALSEVCGGGAIAIVSPNSLITIVDTAFDRNVAGQAGGGALAVNGAGVTVTLRNVTFTNNRAIDGGSGGAIVVRPSAQSARVELDSVTIAACSADLAGGAIARLPTSSNLIFMAAGNLISACSATFGGALAIMDVGEPSTAITGNVLSEFPTYRRVAAPIRASVYGPVNVARSTAAFGGMFFGCNHDFVNLTGFTMLDESRASSAGGYAFLCRLFNSTQSPFDTFFLLPSVASRRGTVDASGYGDVAATPPVRVSLSEFPAEQMSGVALQAGRAALVDAFGSIVRLSVISMRLGLHSSSALAPQGASAVAQLEGSSYSFASTALSLAGWPASLGGSVQLVVGIDDNGVLLEGIGAPQASISVVVTGCAQGWGRASTDDSSVPLVCEPCVGESTSKTPELGSACVSALCPANSVRAVSNSSLLSPCLCLANFYSPTQTTDVPCEPCPLGATCTGRLAAPVAAPGYFEDRGQFLQCIQPEACLGSSQCARGYSGRLCGRCASGFYALNGKCRPCNKALAAVASVGLVVLALVVAGAVVWFNLARSVSYKFATFSLGLMALQMLALFGRLTLDWGLVPETVFRLVSTLSLNFQLTSPECSVARGIDVWLLKFWLTMLLPVFAALALVAVLGLLYLVGRVMRVPRLTELSLAEHIDCFVRSWFQTLTLMYMPLAATALSVFGCRRDRARVWVLVDNPANVCFDKHWWAALFVPGLLFSLVYCLAIPAAILFLLVRARRGLSTGEFLLKYGFAVARFGSAFWYFELVIMALKLALALAITAFANADGKASAGVVVLTCSLVHLAIVKPYARPVHQAVAVATQGCVTLTLFGGTLGDFTFRRLMTGAGVILTLVCVLVGLALDLWLFAKEERAASNEFVSAEKATSTTVQNATTLDFTAKHVKRSVRDSLNADEVVGARFSVALESLDACTCSGTEPNSMHNSTSAVMSFVPSVIHESVAATSVDSLGADSCGAGSPVTSLARPELEAVA